MAPSRQTQESRVYRTTQSLGTLSFGEGSSGEVLATPLVFGLLSATSVHFPVGTPNRLLWSDKFGPFFAEAQYPSLPRVSSRAPVPLSQSNAVGAASSRSSTYCRSTRVGCCFRKAVRSRCKASTNRVGMLLNPCGNLVHDSCPDSPASGSFHSKANRGWLWGLSLKQKKASFRSNSVPGVGGRQSAE